MKAIETTLWVSVFLKTLASFSCVIIIFVPASIHAAPAFPGAEGFGAEATGGRGGKVIFVDSLVDDVENPSEGSFRWACEKVEGPRMILFRTGGIIDLKKRVEVRIPNITIAAQTAPGDGICIRGSWLSVLTTNVIIRGLRIRPGDNGAVGESDHLSKLDTTGLDISRNSFDIRSASTNIIVDHCSFSWAIDGNVAISGNKQGEAPHNITLQWCLITEGLHKSLHPQGQHSTAMLVAGQNVTQLSLLRNFFGNNDHRNPRITFGTTAELINNIFYNWGGEATIIHGVVAKKIKGGVATMERVQAPHINLIRNAWIKGPNTTKEDEVKLNSLGEGAAIYLRGNAGAERSADTSDGVKETAILAKKGNAAVSTSQPALPSSGAKILSIAETKASILSSAGAITPKRDSVDARVLADFEANQGKIIDTPWQVGGYPNYAAGTPPKDSDNDGMPDDWEESHKLDKDTPNANGRDLDPIYDNVEVYINSLIKS